MQCHHLDHLGDYRAENSEKEKQTSEDKLFLSNVEQIVKKNILGLEETKQYLMVQDIFVKL